MSGIKPTDFPNRPSIDGTEEYYTQLGGVNEKFTTSELKTYFDSFTDYDTSFIEKETISRWVDGKRIHTLTVLFPNIPPSSNSISAFNFAANVDTFISMSFTCKGSVTNKYFTNGSQLTPIAVNPVVLNVGLGQIIFNNGSPVDTLTNVYVTINYTKP